MKGTTSLLIVLATLSSCGSAGPALPTGAYEATIDVSMSSAPRVVEFYADGYCGVRLGPEGMSANYDGRCTQKEGGIEFTGPMGLLFYFQIDGENLVLRSGGGTIYYQKSR